NQWNTEQDQVNLQYSLFIVKGQKTADDLLRIAIHDNLTLVLTDTVSLHLATSSFSGSGLTAVMTPTLTFGPAAIGVYNVEFRVDSKSGDGEAPNVQDGDVLGSFTILPAGCDVAVADV
ncbi:hypothetical protein DC030_14875, partial [Enterococcus faecalis]